MLFLSKNGFNRHMSKHLCTKLNCSQLFYSFGLTQWPSQTTIMPHAMSTTTTTTTAGPSRVIAPECSASTALPQPRDRPYEYVPYDVLETDWLGDPRRLTGKVDDGARYAPGTLVWVLLSKGKPKRPAGTGAATSGYQATALAKKRRGEKNGRKSESSGDAKESKDGAHAGANGETSLNKSRKEFFLRARVVDDNEAIAPGAAGRPAAATATARAARRVLVRYSGGATYRVRAYNLIPILEQDDDGAALPLVVLAPETNIYRRVVKVHATPEDSFVEIGVGARLPQCCHASNASCHLRLNEEERCKCDTGHCSLINRCFSLLVITVRLRHHRGQGAVVHGGGRGRPQNVADGRGRRYRRRRWRRN